MSTTAPGSPSGPDGSPAIVEQPPLPPSEAVQPPKATAQTYRIQYIESLRYIFSHPEWLKNLLVFFVFLLIPVLNNVLLFGYLFEIVEHRHRRLPGPYPTFEVRRFGAYMTRGIWCFLLFNIYFTIMFLVFEVLWNGTLFGSMAAVQSGQWGAIIVAVVIPIILIGLLLFLLLLNVLFWPWFLRAGLSQDVSIMANFRWIVHYYRTMWLETTLVCLFALFASIGLSIVGCALFCLGLLMVGPVMAMAQAHLHCQLYELYLARGGEPIPLRPLPAPPATQA
jgi:hypothetical protein